MKKILFFVLLVAVAALQGCATSRSVVDVSSPSDTSQVLESAPYLYIRNVTDARTFQEAPRSADIPSLGFGGANAAAEEIKARAIGRKRNGWGKAMGDILLPEGGTVEKLVREAATAGFQDAGWRVVQSPNSPQDEMATVDITIKQFWSWFQPGFWSVSANSRVETVFDFSDKKMIAPIVVEYKDRMQFVTDDDWQEAIQQVLTEYRDELAREARPN